MFKKSLALLFFILLTLPAISNNVDNGGHAGTPAGFYDDIDPNSIDDENSESVNYKEENEAFPQIYEDGGVVIPPAQSAKATKDYAKIYNA